MDYLAVVVDGVPGEKPADHLDRLANRPRGPGARDPELGEAGDPGAHPERHSAAGRFGQRGHGHRGEGGMAGVWIGHAGAEPDP